MAAPGDNASSLDALVDRLGRVYALVRFLNDPHDGGEGNAGEEAALRAVVLHRVSTSCEVIATEAAALGREAQEESRGKGAIERANGGGQQWWTIPPTPGPMQGG
jgi:hypothetical protein